MNCAVLTALPAYSLRAALRERPDAALRAAQIIDDPPGHGFPRQLRQMNRDRCGRKRGLPNFDCIFAPSRIGFKDAADFIAHAAEDCELLILRAL